MIARWLAATPQCRGRLMPTSLAIPIRSAGTGAAPPAALEDFKWLTSAVAASNLDGLLLFCRLFFEVFLINPARL